MDKDLAIILANISLHAVIVAILYWRNPLPLRRLLNVYFLSSWISFAGNLLGLHARIWDFPSPTIGRPATELFYDLLSLPLKVLMLIYFLKPSLLYNTLLVLIVAGLTISWEWVALHYTQLIVYHNWFLSWTYLMALIVFAGISYLFQKKIL